MLVAASETDLREIEMEFLREYQHRTKVVDGVKAMLDRWHGHASMGVVSNFFLAGAPRELLRSHQLLTYFDFVIDSAEVGFRKPHPIIFERALGSESRDLQPSEVLMIGDDWNADVQGALAVGLHAIHFTCTDAHDERVPVLQSWDDFHPDSRA